MLFYLSFIQRDVVAFGLDKNQPFDLQKDIMMVLCIHPRYCQSLGIFEDFASQAINALTIKTLQGNKLVVGFFTIVSETIFLKL